MRRAWLAVLPLVAGCATGPFAWPSTMMLAKADRLATEGNYRSAIVAYDDDYRNATHGVDNRTLL